MIDGDAQTAWVSAGNATGATILLEFNEPVTVGAVGMTASSSQADKTSFTDRPPRHVLGATSAF